MGKDGRAVRPLTFRKPWALEISVAAWGVAALGIGLQVFLTGLEAFSSAIVPWLAMMAWAAYILAWRPRVTVTESGFEVCNGEKTHYIPFNAVEDIQNRYRVVITAHGKRYVSQVGARPGKVAVGAQSNDEDPVTAAWLSGRFAQGQHGTRVITRWNYALMVLGAVPVIWFFTIWLQFRPYGFN